MKGRGIAALALLYAPIHPSAWRDCLKKRDRFTKWSLLDRQKGSRRPRLVVLDHWGPTVEGSSSLFQTVSPRTRVNSVGWSQGVEGKEEIPTMEVIST